MSALPGGESDYLTALRSYTDAIYQALVEFGIEVLYDDRPMRPGPKFVDADLIGIPLRVAVGKRSLAEGKAELKWRDSDQVDWVALDCAAQIAAERVRTRLAELGDDSA